MSDEIQVSDDSLNDSLNKSEPQFKIQEMLESLEIMAFQKGKAGSNVDINSFSPGQKDRLLDILQENESNAFTFHTKRIDNAKEIRLAEITSNTVEQRTNRYAVLSIIPALVLITLIILIYKESYFNIWLSFLSI